MKDALTDAEIKAMQIKAHKLQLEEVMRLSKTFYKTILLSQIREI